MWNNGDTVGWVIQHYPYADIPWFPSHLTHFAHSMKLHAWLAVTRKASGIEREVPQGLHNSSSQKYNLFFKRHNEGCWKHEWVYPLSSNQQVLGAGWLCGTPLLLQSSSLFLHLRISHAYTGVKKVSVLSTSFLIGFRTCCLTPRLSFYEKVKPLGIVFENALLLEKSKWAHSQRFLSRFKHFLLWAISVWGNACC